MMKHLYQSRRTRVLFGGLLTIASVLFLVPFEAEGQGSAHQEEKPPSVRSEILTNMLDSDDSPVSARQIQRAERKFGVPASPRLRVPTSPRPCVRVSPTPFSAIAASTA
jgi:hypothetical protein